MITSSLTEALGWTLLHSLWQATLVAGAFYLVRRVIRHRPTQVYTAALGALLVIVGWTVYTFVDLYESENAATSTAVTHLASPPTPLRTTISPMVYEASPVSKPVGSSWLDHAVAWMNPYINFVAMGWLLGMVILSTRLAGGLWYLDRLRRRHACPLLAWEATVAALAGGLRIRRPVAIMASSIAKVPMVIGHLKPLILLPVAVLSSLSPEQIEAILAHELAHVRRHDYRINLLQSFVELVFFYHPAVRWVSSVAREEREKCCDDLAVSLLGGDTVAYAKALSEAELLQHPADPLVVAFAPRRGSLLVRIERLVAPRNSSTGLAAKAVAILPMLLLVTYLAGSDTLAHKAVNGESPAEAISSAASPQDLSIPAPSDRTRSVAETKVIGSEGESIDAPAADAQYPSDTIPGANPDENGPGRVSFHFGDSSDFSFGMNFSFDTDDSIGQQGFHHWRFSSSDTFPDFAWNDSLWLESVGELSETMGAFSDELATYLEDSVDTEAVQQRLSSVQRELSRLQAELGTTLRQNFSDEKMEALQERLQREQERLGRDFQEKSRQLQERQQRFQKEAQRRNEENESRRKLEELQRDLEAAEQQLDYEDRAEDRQRLEEVQRALEEMPQQSDDESEWRNEESNRRLEEARQALEEAEQQLKGENQPEDRQRLEELQRNLEMKQTLEKLNGLIEQSSPDQEDLPQDSLNQTLEKLNRESKQLRQDQERVQFLSHDFDQTVDLLEEELLADGLIKSGKEYRFELKPKGLYVNRKKQDEEVLAKYRDLLEVSENTNFSITRIAR